MLWRWILNHILIILWIVLFRNDDENGWLAFWKGKEEILKEVRIFWAVMIGLLVIGAALIGFFKVTLLMLGLFFVELLLMFMAITLVINTWTIHALSSEYLPISPLPLPSYFYSQFYSYFCFYFEATIHPNQNTLLNRNLNHYHSPESTHSLSMIFSYVLHYSSDSYFRYTMGVSNYWSIYQKLIIVNHWYLSFSTIYIYI